MSTLKERAEFLRRFNAFSDAEEKEQRAQRRAAQKSLKRMRAQLCDEESERLLVAAMKRKGISV